MIFIFGISPKEQTIGPAEERICPRCNNQRFWILKKSSQWFSLFFIPLIPFGSKYFMQCPICGEAEFLSKEQFVAKEKDAELNNQLVHGTINEDEYHKHKNAK